jgi:hypothetical protein
MMARTTACGVAVLALSLFCLSRQPAHADDCQTLLRLTSMDMTPVPGGQRMLIPVTINGVPKKLLLGIAGGLTTLNDSTAQSLNLRTKDSASRLLDSAGNVSKHYVHVDSFQMGNMRASGRDFMITPDRNAGENPPNDGVFAASLLYHYDVEMDFAAAKLSYFSPDHCAGHVIYWPAAAVGVVPFVIRKRTDNSARKGGFTDQMPTTRGLDLSSAGGEANVGGDPIGISPMGTDPMMTSNAFGIAGSDIQIHVLLDGKDFTANIDTGLEQSTLNTDAAKAVFAVTAESPSSAPAGNLNADGKSRETTRGSETVTVYGLRIFEHTFHTLSFGDITVTNPHFLVRPDLTGDNDPENKPVTGSRVSLLDDNVEPDISIGMNVLKQLHLYFAFKEQKLYVTPAASKPASSPG